MDISKPICLHGLRFSRVTQKAGLISQTTDNIDLAVSLSSVEGLLELGKPSNFSFIQALNITLINAETANIHDTAHQFWEQKGPRAMIMKNDWTVVQESRRLL